MILGNFCLKEIDHILKLLFGAIIKIFICVGSRILQPNYFIAIRSDEGLTLETSAFESLYYGGQFTLSTQLIKPNYLVILPTDAAPQFL